MGSFVENVNKMASLTPTNVEDLSLIVRNIDAINQVAPLADDLNDIIDNVIPNLDEILQADNSATTATEQATIATTQAGIATTKAGEAEQFRNEAEAFNESKAFVVDTVEDLLTIPSSYVTAVVRDLNRGGTFIWSATGTANRGTVFAGATGYWNRQYSGAVNVKWFGANGDGVTDDTAVFTLLEKTNTGKTVELSGLTYLVSSIPNKNKYVNGSFKTTNGSSPVYDVYAQPAPLFHAYGGQLRTLRKQLTDPLVQQVGIVFIGDSITWGRTLPENAVYDPRDGTLSDPRDAFTTPSFVNEFKRYIGSQYAHGGTPVLSNWYASPSGEAIAEYSVTNVLYPREEPFSLTVSGPSILNTEQASSATSLGFQFQLSDGNVAGTSWQKISFPFTGNEFTFLYSCFDDTQCDYELIVDGVSQGLFQTGVADGVVNNSYKNRRTHTFNYVKNKMIEIKTNRTSYTTGSRVLRIEGIEVTKKIRITNQGINGATTKSYALYNLSGNFGDGVAVGATDNFIIMQLGTNDRIITTTTPKGIQGFRRNLTTILNTLVPLGNLIVMTALPSTNEAPETYSFTMQECRSVLLAECAARSLDFIDNYALFNSVPLSVFTTDGLHPNSKGHQRIAHNIIGALETA